MFRATEENEVPQCVLCVHDCEVHLLRFSLSKHMHVHAQQG